MAESLIVTVSHHFHNVAVAALYLQEPLEKGDRIHITGHTTDLVETIESMEIDHQPVEKAEPRDQVAIKVQGRVREGDQVFLATEDNG